MTTTTILSDNGVSSGSAGIKTTGGNDGTLQLQTTTSGGTATTAVTIDTSQNVGIGTSSPTYALQISGTTNKAVFVENTLGVNAFFGPSGAGVAQYGSTNAGIRFLSNNAEAMRIDTSGNLLVGTTSQVNVSKFSFVGDFYNANGMSLKTTNDGTGAQFIGFLNSSGTVIGGVNRVTTTNAVVYNTTSDQRLKSNIEDALPILDKLMQVQVRQYDWTEGDLHQDYGFIAQELEPVLSGVVTKGKTEEDIWQLDYSRLTPHLVKAIQEQQAIIQTLEARLAALEAK